MRIFRATYRDRERQQRSSQKWYIEFTDHLEITRRVPAFEDHRLTEAVGRHIKSLVHYKVGGEQPDPQLSQWVEQIPQRLRKYFARIGLLDPRRAAGGGLARHIADFEASLKSKGSTAEYVDLTIGRLKRLVTGCKFITWADITANAVQRYLTDLRSGGTSPQTINYYLLVIRQFCRWMVQERRAGESPVQHLKGLNVRTDRRHDRRALEVDELRHLLEVTRSGPPRYGMTGAARAMLYQTATETGLRAGEVRSLTVAALDTANCTLTVLAAFSKHRREDAIPLKPETARELAAFVANKLPTAKMFNMPDRWRLGRMLQADLSDSGIPYVDEAGRYFDFHGFRHQFISNLAQAGVNPKTVQTLARHSTIVLTMNRYVHNLRGDEAAALAALPDLSPASTREAKMTGTDPDGTAETSSENCLLPCLLSKRGNPCTSVDAGGRNTAKDIESHNSLESPITPKHEGSEAGGDNAPAGIRTQALRIRNPLLNSRKSLKKQPLTETEKRRLLVCLAENLRASPELTALVLLWPRLPERVRKTIVHLATYRENKRRTLSGELRRILAETPGLRDALERQYRAAKNLKEVKGLIDLIGGDVG